MASYTKSTKTRAKNIAKALGDTPRREKLGAKKVKTIMPSSQPVRGKRGSQQKRPRVKK